MTLAVTLEFISLARSLLFTCSMSNQRQSGLLDKDTCLLLIHAQQAERKSLSRIEEEHRQ